MTTPTGLPPYLELLQEVRNIEYKQSAPWEELEYKIVKTALGMANLRDGGRIIIGVATRENQLIREGIQPDHLQTYSIDTILSRINEYADPYVRIQLLSYSDGAMTFLEIYVAEFDDIPIICKRDGRENLQRGTVYSRPHRIAESCRVSSQTEMRDIVDRAVEKSLRAFLARTRRVCLIHETPVILPQNDLLQFDRQAEEV